MDVIHRKKQIYCTTYCWFQHVSATFTSSSGKICQIWWTCFNFGWLNHLKGSDDNKWWTDFAPFIGTSMLTPLKIHMFEPKNEALEDDFPREIRFHGVIFPGCLGISLTPYLNPMISSRSPRKNSKDANGVDLSTGFRLRTHGLGSSNSGWRSPILDRSLQKEIPIPLLGSQMFFGICEEFNSKHQIRINKVDITSWYLKRSLVDFWYVPSCHAFILHQYHRGPWFPSWHWWCRTFGLYQCLSNRVKHGRLVEVQALAGQGWLPSLVALHMGNPSQYLKLSFSLLGSWMRFLDIQRGEMDVCGLVISNPVTIHAMVSKPVLFWGWDNHTTSS